MECRPSLRRLIILVVVLVLFAVMLTGVYALDSTGMLKAGDKAFSAGEFEVAERNYQEALRFHPKNYRILKSLAETKIRLDKFKEAVVLLDRALALPVATGRDILVLMAGETKPQEAELVDETVMEVDTSSGDDDLAGLSKFLRHDHQKPPVPHYRVFLKRSGKMKLLPKSKTQIEFEGIPLATRELILAIKTAVQKKIVAENKGEDEKMVDIAGGCFRMGSDLGDPDEQPVHEVCVSSFKLAQFEVTQSNFQSITGTNPSQHVGANLPVDSVTWDEARNYCLKSQKRLPSEAEWEYAARASSTTQYYWGDKVSGKEGNFCDRNCKLNIRNPSLIDGFEHSAPVGSFPPNKWGLYDMAGNLGEWVSDWMLESYYLASPKNNPKGPNPNLDVSDSFSITNKVYRGGSWNQMSPELRSANRRDSIYQLRAEGIGFRCAANGEAAQVLKAP